MRSIFFQLLSVSLIPLLATGPLPAQSFPSGAAVESDSLRVGIADHVSAEIPAGSQAAKGLTFVVTDASGSPVPDAAVVVRLPDGTPTGTFPDGTHAAVAYTGQEGGAIFPPIHWATAPGIVSIKVTTTRGTAHAAMLFSQTLGPVGNQPPAPTPPPSTWVPPAISPDEVEAKAVTPQGSRSPVRSNTAGPTVVADATSADAPAVRQPGAISPKPAPIVVAALEQPKVTVTNEPSNEKIQGHSSKTKWIIILAVIAAGAGAGIVVAGKGKGSSTASTGVTIGAPTVSVGHP